MNDLPRTDYVFFICGYMLGLLLGLSAEELDRAAASEGLRAEHQQHIQQLAALRRTLP